MKRWILSTLLVLYSTTLWAADAPKLADVKSVTIVWSDGKTLTLAVMPDGTMQAAFGFGDIRTLQLVDVTQGIVTPVVPTPPKPGPKPTPAPKPPTIQPEAIGVVILEDAASRTPEQAAVQKWLEDSLRTPEVSRFRRYDVSDEATVSATYRRLMGARAPPCMFVIGSKSDGSAGTVLSIIDQPVTIEAAKAALVAAGWKEGK